MKITNKCPLCKRPAEIVAINLPVVSKGKKSRKKFPALLAECCATIFVEENTK